MADESRVLVGISFFASVKKCGFIGFFPRTHFTDTRNRERVNVNPTGKATSIPSSIAKELKHTHIGVIVMSMIVCLYVKKEKILFLVRSRYMGYSLIRPTCL